MDMERFSLKELNEGKLKTVFGYNQNKLAALNNLEGNGTSNRYGTLTIGENIKILVKISIGYCGSNNPKSSFDVFSVFHKHHTF
jgi:hypothetical protein